MSEELRFALSLFGAVSGTTSLVLTLRMAPAERREYEFFLSEHREKLGCEPGLKAKLASWNAAIGGKAPKWHWIPPVRSSSGR
ncbi:hypothetical protein ABIC83_002790 [Roseateles asaccharophilus]|uniref:hypothetical protein n=1 Tax=Roseateles asaccharophilus TaxID=582607 RepID=UPI003839CC1D